MKEGAPMSVLLVEMEPELRRACAEELARCGFHAEAAAWEGAMLAAREAAPQVLVVDGTLEPARAARLVREVRSDDRLAELPVVGIAAAGGAHQELMAAGAHCCLRSLSGPADVLRAVRWAAEVYG
jgi:DNA-binding response OmpR family regulator